MSNRQIKKINNTSGFTLLEVIITLSILGGLITFGMSEINQTRARAELTTTTNEIVSALQVTQNQSISATNGISVSMCFNQNKNLYKIVGGSDCSAKIAVYKLPEQTFFKQIILDNEDKVEFKKLTGSPIYPGKIIISHKQLPAQEMVINISKKGVISIL